MTTEPGQVISPQALRVLVTDDEVGMRLGVTRTLQRFRVPVPCVGQEVCLELEQAESGEQALEQIARHPPDILLLDHKLPGMSGLDVLDRLMRSEHGAKILVIMMTAYATMEAAVTATQRGAYDFLAKPFTPDDLRGRVAKAAVRLALAREVERLQAENRLLREQLKTGVWGD